MQSYLIVRSRERSGSMKPGQGPIAIFLGLPDVSHVSRRTFDPWLYHSALHVRLRTEFCQSISLHGYLLPSASRHNLSHQMCHATAIKCRGPLKTTSPDMDFRPESPSLHSPIDSIHGCRRIASSSVKVHVTIALSWVCRRCPNPTCDLD